MLTYKTTGKYLEYIISFRKRHKRKVGKEEVRKFTK